MGIVKRKRKSKPYQATVWVSGMRVATRSFETGGAAHSWHDATKRRFETGYGPAGEMTLAEVMEAYRGKALATMTPPTRLRYSKYLDLLTTAPVAKVQMTEFTGARVDQLLDWLIGHPKAETACRKSFRAELAFLKGVFAFYREHYDERSVCPVMRRHGKRADFKGAVPAKRSDFYLTAADARRWFEALRQDGEPAYHDLARFQVIMGTRIGETVALCWDAVDLERGLVEIRRTMEWNDDDGKCCRRIVARTKTARSRRTLPMPAEVLAILRGAKARDPDSLVVFRNRRGALLHGNSIRYAYDRAFKKAGLPWRGTHICRDTNATLAIGMVRAEAVQINLGHASVRQTEAYAKTRATVENVVPATVAELLRGDKR